MMRLLNNNKGIEMKSLWTAMLFVLFLAACASNPNKIQATYVSPMIYKDYDCDQLAMERSHVERRTNELYHSLKGESDKDTAQMTVGLILFWPTLFFLEGGDGPEATEYARLKGEYEALREVSVSKKCEIGFAKELQDTVSDEAPEEEAEGDAEDRT